MTLTEVVILRLVGGASGSLIAVAIVQPNTWSGFFKRSSVSITTALILSPVLMDYLAWLQTGDNVIASSCIAAAIGWWGWHTIIRIAQTWRREGES